MSSTDNEDNKGGDKSVDISHPEVQFSIAELLRESRGSPQLEQAIDPNRQQAKEQSLREQETHRVGLEKYYELRDKWSKYVRSYIWFMLVFQLFLTLCIGFKWGDFSEYKSFVYIVMAQNFAQIVGMGYIVANYLFPKGKP